MTRYAILYRHFLIQHLKTYLEYRWNFIIGASSTFVEHAARLFAIWVVIRQIPSLGGWSFDELLFLYGLVTAARSIEHTFANNLWRIGHAYIRNGDFDRFLVRPINPLFHLLADQFNHDGIGNLLMGIGLMVKSSLALGLEWTFFKLVFVVIAVLAGGLIFISLNLITATSAFWIIESTPVTLAIFELHEFSRYPLSMYGNVVAGLLTWVIPYGLAAFYPAMFLLGCEVGWLAFASPIMAIMLFVVAYQVWQIGLRHYQGTGS